MRKPWEVAAAEGKTIIGRVIGPMIGVYYPYRQTGDLYVAAKGSPIHCCQCGASVGEGGEFLAHVQHHNRRKRKYPDVIIDALIVAPAVTSEDNTHYLEVKSDHKTLEDDQRGISSQGKRAFRRRPV